MSTPKPQRVKLAAVSLPPLLLRLRDDPAHVTELAGSMARVGLLNPITVRPEGKGYVVIAGRHRYKAARSLGWEEIDVTIRQVNELDALDLGVAENLCRLNLSPVEEAAIIYDQHHTHGLELTEISRRWGRSPEWVKDRLDLAEYPDPFKQALHLGETTLAAAKYLLKITDPQLQTYYLDQARVTGASARTALSWWQQWEATRVPTDAPHSVEGGMTPQPRTGPPRLLCGVCRTPHAIDALHHVQACGSCYETLLDLGYRLQQETPPS